MKVLQAAENWAAMTADKKAVHWVVSKVELKAVLKVDSTAY